MHPLYIFSAISFILSCAGCQYPNSNSLEEHGNKKSPTAYNEENATLLVKNVILAREKIEPNEKMLSFKVGSADLNNDGHLELLILMQTPYFCGTGGCSTYLFDDSGSLLHTMTVTKEPILLSRRENEGWKTFYVWSAGKLREMVFENGSYPSNPSLEKGYNRNAELKAARYAVKTSEIYQQDGYELEFVQPSELLQDVHQYQFSFRHYGDPLSLYIMTVDMVTGSRQIENRATN